MSKTLKSEYNSSDEELQEAFAKGFLKPGLNVVETNRQPKNCVNLMKQKLKAIKLDLPWVEKLDINGSVPLAPEMLQIQEQEIKRETMFMHQAQSAVLGGFKKLKELGRPTYRPDDYFAEMAKTDEHMTKVRKKLMERQAIAQRSERVRQLRQQKKVTKQMQVEATLKKHAEKRKMLDEVKKYRRGVRKDLDFLDDKRKQRQNS